jgi:hypothetical protein
MQRVAPRPTAVPGDVRLDAGNTKFEVFKDAEGRCLAALHRHLQKLADAAINVTAADAVAAGQGRYGMILWVKPRDYTRAAKALGAR